MKKMIVAILVAGALSTPAMADHWIIHKFEGVTFKTRGECESNLKRYRNRLRENHPELTGSEYNALAKEKRACERNANGEWIIT